MGTLRIVTLYTFFVAFLSACASQISPEILAHQHTAAQVFRDELDLFLPRDEDEAAIKAILVRIKESYLTCDKILLMSVFSKDYEQAVLIPHSSAMIISRAEYFAGVGMEKGNEDECKKLQRHLSMAKIRVVRSKTPSDRIEVVLLTTYASKYFNPRFIEAFIFRRGDGKMVVDKKVITPLHPKSPEYYQAELYIGDMSEFEKYKDGLQRMAWEEGDIFIDRILRKHTYQDLPVDNKPKSVIAVFREPPPPGAKIKIAHWYYNKRGDLQSSFEENHTVEKVNPWFFLVTQSTIFAMGDVDYEVFVNGTMILGRRYGTTWVTY